MQFPGTQIHTSPGSYARAIAPSDGTPLSEVTRGIYVGTGGDVTVIFAGDTVPVTLVGVPGGSLLPISVRFVQATGTTASNLVAGILDGVGGGGGAGRDEGAEAGELGY